MMWRVVVMTAASVMLTFVAAQDTSITTSSSHCCHLLNSGKFEEFQACTVVSGTEPSCSPTCQYEGKEYHVMETVKSVPYHCIRLECDLSEADTESGTYNTTSLKLVVVDENPGCCMRGGRMLPHGYIERDSSVPCGQVLCDMGEWVSRGLQPYCGQPLKECHVGEGTHAHGDTIKVDFNEDTVDSSACLRHRCHHGRVIVDACCCVGQGSVVACVGEEMTDSCSEHICEAGSLTTLHHRGCCLIKGERYRDGQVVYPTNNSHPCTEWVCQDGILVPETLDTCCRGPGGKLVPLGHPILLDPAKCLLVVCEQGGEATDRSVSDQCGCCEAGLKLYTNGSTNPLNQCLDAVCNNSTWIHDMKPECVECNLARPGAGTLRVRNFNSSWSAIRRNCLKYTILQDTQEQRQEFKMRGERGTPTIYMILDKCDPGLMYANPYAFQQSVVREQRIRKRHPFLSNLYTDTQHTTSDRRYYRQTVINQRLHQQHKLHRRVKSHPYFASNNKNNNNHRRRRRQHHHFKRQTTTTKNNNTSKSNKTNERHHDRHHVKRQSGTAPLIQERDNDYYNYYDLQLNQFDFSLPDASSSGEGWCCKSITIHDDLVNVTLLVTSVLLINGMETRLPWSNEEGDWVADVYPNSVTVKVAHTVMWLLEERGLKVMGVVTSKDANHQGVCVSGHVSQTNHSVWGEGEACEEEHVREMEEDTTPSTNPTTTSTNITTTSTNATTSTTNVTTTTTTTNVTRSSTPITTTNSTFPTTTTTTTTTFLPTIPNKSISDISICPPHLLLKYTLICGMLASEEVTAGMCEKVTESEGEDCVVELCGCQPDEALICLYWITLRHIRRCVALTSPPLATNTTTLQDEEIGVEKKAFALARSLLPSFQLYLKDLVLAMGPLGEGMRAAIDTFMEFFAPNIVKFLKAVLSVSNNFIPALTPLLVDIESVLFHPKMSLLHSFNGAFQQLVINLQEPTRQYVEQMVPVCANFSHQVSLVVSAMRVVLEPTVRPALATVLGIDLQLLHYVGGHLEKILSEVDNKRVLDELTNSVRILTARLAPFKLEEIYKVMQVLEKSLDSISEGFKAVVESGFSESDLICVFDKFGVTKFICQGWIDNPYCSSLQQ